jgi:hypothetical protein
MSRNLLLSGLVVASVFFLGNFSNTQAQTFKNKQVEYVDVKCHVLLASGKPMITLLRVDKVKVSSIREWLIGKTVTTPDSIKKVVVNEVYECITSEKEFKNLKVKLLDAKTAR